MEQCVTDVKIQTATLTNCLYLVIALRLVFFVLYDYSKDITWVERRTTATTETGTTEEHFIFLWYCFSLKMPDMKHATVSSLMSVDLSYKEQLCHVFL